MARRIPETKERMRKKSSSLALMQSGTIVYTAAQSPQVNKCRWGQINCQTEAFSTKAASGPIGIAWLLAQLVAVRFGSIQFGRGPPRYHTRYGGVLWSALVWNNNTNFCFFLCRNKVWVNNEKRSGTQKGVL